MDAKSTVFGSEPIVEQERKIINVLYLGRNLWPLRNRKGGEAAEHENIDGANRQYLTLRKYAEMRGEGAASEPFGSCHGKGDRALQSS